MLPDFVRIENEARTKEWERLMTEESLPQPAELNAKLHRAVLEAVYQRGREDERKEWNETLNKAQARGK